MRKILFILVLLQSSLVFALDCDKAVTTPDINACEKIELDKVERTLNQVYQRVLKQMDKISRDPNNFTNKSNLKKSFVDAQRLWIRFRKADCDTVYTYWSDGTIRGSMYLACMTSRANQRIKELKLYEETY